ncbi:putative phosphoribosylpyrophosphate synthetase [Trypanosoma conorhini]|uniref:Putative phosphoribosylpyrophosphate synthetase n=1 Tax=Trypanosoma conorhini TaxID=83891 RepID=A0A422NEI5_9TRYP|nr:putative phosphoribosylpyrophosphate synthetase [Trypanosoma conorhini]RNF03873.1 putative phosphoribosylpyrophosphate synthetase [Trypanosoma conorhini]
MDAALFPSATSATIFIDAEAAAVVQLNTIFRRCGLHVSTASTQLHITPETVYVLSRDDVAVIARLSRVLVTNVSVRCDFSALCGVLWGHAKEVEKVLDKHAQKPLDDEFRPQETASRQLVPHVLLLAHVFHTLRHIEEPFAREEVKEAVHIVQKDVEIVVRLALKVAQAFDFALKNLKRSDTAYLRALEFCQAAIGVFAAAIATRKTLDVSPLLALFNSDLVWHLSGAGVLATESYCEAVRRLIFAAFARQDDFVGVEQVAVQLLLHRLTNRPPFDWESFRRLYILRDAELPAAAALTPQYGLLRYMSIVQACVEALLLADEPWTKSLRRQTFKTLRQMNKKQMLSFFQVSLLAALEGMPELDLSEDAELQRRAVVTHLIVEHDTSNTMPPPSFLRILLAHGYTVPHMDHGALKRTSILSLLRAISEQLFQVPLIQSGEANKLTDLTLIPPVLTRPLLQLILDAAAADAETAREVVSELHQITGVVYEANCSQCASLLSARKMPVPLRRISVSTMRLLVMFFESHAILQSTDHSMALESFARVYAVLAFYGSATKNATDMEKEATLRMILKVGVQLPALAQMMRAEEINTFFVNVILPCTSMEKLQQKNRQQYALQEAYVRAFASSAVALAMDEMTVLRHWVDTALRCIKNSLSGALSVAGLNFFSAVFLSRRAIAPLFVPTYVALMVPITNSKRYKEPPLLLLHHFAKGVRAICQGVEECDEQLLAGMMQNKNSTLSKFLSEHYGEGKSRPTLDGVRPLSCVLLVVSTLFEKVCLILGNTTTAATSSRQERIVRFQAYFSALINLLQCRSRTVLHRVCASVEAVVLEHLRGVPRAQLQWMNYITATVDLIEGTGKKELVEWLLKLNEKARIAIPHPRL